MASDRLAARRAARAAAAGVKAGLTPERVVQAALQLIDEAGGFEEFSMRRLARTLHVTPMALYSHVRDRDELLSRVAGAILVEIEVPGPSAPWPDRLRAIGAGYRQAVRHHPSVTPYVVRALALHTAESLPVAEALLAVLVDAGFRGEMVLTMYRAVVGTIVGFVQVEIEAGTLAGQASATPAPSSETAADTANRVLVQTMLGRSSLPIAAPSEDAAFDGLMQLLIGGIEALASSRD